MDQPSPLEQIRERLALAVGENAVFDGWTARRSIRRRTSSESTQAQARLAYPKRPGRNDRRLYPGRRPGDGKEASAEKLRGMKIREKIRALVWTRIEIMTPAREALRRACRSWRCRTTRRWGFVSAGVRLT
jgi:ubiquinone biosynthesis protein COQ9